MFPLWLQILLAGAKEMSAERQAKLPLPAPSGLTAHSELQALVKSRIEGGCRLGNLGALLLIILH